MLPVDQRPIHEDCFTYLSGPLEVEMSQPRPVMDENGDDSASPEGFVLVE
jgi:hypothetical protein